MGELFALRWLLPPMGLVCWAGGGDGAVGACVSTTATWQLAAVFESTSPRHHGERVRSCSCEIILMQTSGHSCLSGPTWPHGSLIAPPTSHTQQRTQPTFDLPYTCPNPEQATAAQCRTSRRRAAPRPPSSDGAARSPAAPTPDPAALPRRVRGAAPGLGRRGAGRARRHRGGAAAARGGAAAPAAGRHGGAAGRPGPPAYPPVRPPVSCLLERRSGAAR